MSGRGRMGGRGFGRGGGGRGGGRGPSGECVCPQCGYRVPHAPGTPCRSIMCPRCGIPLIRA
ncbi:MAG: hypothetical protein DRJ97_01320 [Thermoprotei archaeon]|nr:MAG: hypothetical protein DRJ97_01320 [Thermoprotei archaeon]